MFRVSDENTTYFKVLREAMNVLQTEHQSAFAAEWLLRERLNWNKTDLIKNYQEKISEVEIKQFEKDMNCFISGKPMQQIIGHEWFYGRKFKVNQFTLIPRPETEEWFARVQQILPQRKLKVLDIGTGTGVLGLSHKLERPEDSVTVTDISEEALKIAKENANKLNADVLFKNGNLVEPVTGDSFDVILCNPPYISEKELSLMDDSVIHHEPSSALFAEEDGLAIYKELASSMGEVLKKNSFVFLEIGYGQGERVKGIFQRKFPNAQVEIWKDYNQLNRVVAIYLGADESEK